MQVSIKDVDDRIFREFRAESVREGMNVGRALSLAMKLWLDSKGRKPRLSIINFKPTHWGKGTERTSEEIDKILYG